MGLPLLRLLHYLWASALLSTSLRFMVARVAWAGGTGALDLLTAGTVFISCRGAGLRTPLPFSLCSWDGLSFNFQREGPEAG